MTRVTSRKTGKYKNALILMPKENGRGLVASVVSGCVVLDTGVELTTTSTVDDEVSDEGSDEGSGEGFAGSIGKRFVLHFSSVQHSATQRAKYIGPERLSFLSLQSVMLHLPASP